MDNEHPCKPTLSEVERVGQIAEKTRKLQKLTIYAVFNALHPEKGKYYVYDEESKDILYWGTSVTDCREWIAKETENI